MKQMVFQQDSAKPNRGIVRILYDEIKKIPRSQTKQTILEIGCGVGRNSIELAKRLQTDLVGIDNVKDVVIQAKTTYPEGEWVLLDADEFNIKKESYEIGLLIFVLHLLQHPIILLKKLIQGLKKPDGRLYIVTVGHDQLTSGIYAQYFPEAVQYDLNRFPKVSKLQEQMTNLGLQTWIRTHRYFQRVTDPISIQSWVQRVQQRSFSSFNVYTPDELSSRLHLMETALTHQIQDKKINLRRKTTIICARHNNA